MIQFYVCMIRKGKMTPDEVPALWRQKVREILVQQEKG